MKEGIAFAHERNAKVYVAANMVAHAGDTEGAGEFFLTLRDIGIDAVIVSDPALISTCFQDAPGLPVHLSTQASATNYKTLEFWKKQGLERVVLAREVSMQEIQEIGEKPMLKWKHLFMGQCVFPTLVVVHYRIIWLIVMRTAAVVRRVVVGNMTYSRLIMAFQKI